MECFTQPFELQFEEARETRSIVEHAANGLYFIWNFCRWQNWTKTRTHSFAISERYQSKSINETLLTAF